MNSKFQTNSDNQSFFKKSALSSAVALGATLLSVGVVAFPDGFELEEVVVTATRRAATVQEIPYNISAVTGDTIKDAGVSDLNDLVRLVPGLTSTDMGGDAGVNNSLVMRGLNANNPGLNNILPNAVEPAVSTYLNDTPVFLNLKLTDIERVEVLRGPQGTLYGSGSVGGTVRFIFNKPSTEETTASISGGYGRSSHSSEGSYNLDVVGNLPLADNLAVRVATGYEETGGVTDADSLFVIDSSGQYQTDGSGNAVTRSEKDTDGRDVTYFRGSLLWDVSDETEVLFSYHHQENNSDGDTYKRITDEKTSGESWEHDKGFIEPSEFEADVASLEIETDVGFATLTSSTSHTSTDVTASNEISGLYTRFYGDTPRKAALTIAEGDFEAITQEFRLVSNGDGDWDWVTGIYYSDSEANLIAKDVDYGGFVGLDASFAPYDGYFYMDRTNEFEDKAVFGELTWHVSEEWQMTVGARRFWQEFESSQLFGGFGGVWSEAANSAKFQDNIFKFNTSYDLNEDTMVYFTWAEGFRHGGANGLPLDGPAGVGDANLLTYDADEATNWELGIKGKLGDRITYTLSGFQIDWKDVQLDNFLGGFSLPGVLNGDEAQSQGLELETSVHFTENLSVNIGYSYTTAEIVGDADLGGRIARDGDSLPGVSKNQISVNLDYYQPLDNEAELHYNFNGAYRSSQETAINEDFRDYTKLDGYSILYTSVTWSRDQYSVGLFVDNITDEEALSAVVIRYEDDFGFVGRPRTYGVNFSYRFE